PIINGYNICRLLKSQEGQKHIPVILLTSRAGDEDRKIGVEVGADAYIPKPFKTEDLLSKARDLLNP
ncbi:MAG: response regulator, partial [Candidatus Omnitrophota bacterium]|nr:response regulator [Candidatus Omnitrophota bacterium]